MIEMQFDLGTAQDIMNGELFGSIKTRDGHPARIICTDAKGKRPIVALFDIGEMERVARYTVNGRHDERDNVASNMDLVLEVEGGEQ